MAQPGPDHEEDEAVVSGRLPSMLPGVVVLGSVVVVVSAVVALVAGTPWPVLVGVVLLGVLVGPAIPAHWRHRHDFAALRRARRRVVAAYSPIELRMMTADSPGALHALVRSQCAVADQIGGALLIEVDEDDGMRETWRQEGFEEAEGVDTQWGHVALLVRRPRS